MDVSLLYFLITNLILQQNCFICLQRFGHQSQKKNKVSQNLISWPKQTYGSLLVYQITPLLLLFTHRIVYYWKSAHQGTRGANSLSLGQGISAQFFFFIDPFCSMCGMSGAGIDGGVLCLCFTKSISIARSEYLETISKKNYICVIRRPCTNLFMYDIVLYKSFLRSPLSVGYQNTTLYWVYLLQSSRNCKQNKMIDPEQTNNPMMLRLNSF